MLQAVLLKVFELAGSETDHIPPVMVSCWPIFIDFENWGMHALQSYEIPCQCSMNSKSRMPKKQTIEMRCTRECPTFLHLLTLDHDGELQYCRLFTMEYVFDFLVRWWSSGGYCSETKRIPTDTDAMKITVQLPPSNFILYSLEISTPSSNVP